MKHERQLEESRRWWETPLSGNWRSWDMAVGILLVLPFAIVPSYLQVSWWVQWAAPVAWACLFFTWVKVRRVLTERADSREST